MGFVGQESQGNILVVDDNPLIASVLRSVLAAEHFHVQCCDNGEEAVKVLTNQPVDLIVCDVMMPKMGGYELHHKVRENPSLCHVPFVFLTALDSSEDRLRGLETGVDDYVTKPFDPKELVTIIRGRLKRVDGLRKQAEEKYDLYRRKVLHTLSHEFRTPLVAISTGTELLLENSAVAEQNKIKNLVEAIQRGGLRLERLVSDFMLLQQIEAGLAQRLYDTRAGVLSVDEVVRGILERITPIFAEGKATWESVNLLGGEKIKIFEPQVWDIMTRIAHNAVKFSKPPVHVELAFVRLSDEVAFEVKDRGIGIDVDRVKEAVTLFSQIDRDKLEQQGSGVGLAIAHRYARINNGRLEFESREGGGAIVSLVLPIVKS